MQFTIRLLLALMVAVSLLCGVMFAAPPIVATPILLGLLWISPALWINGIIYGRGGWRPFFIGGTMAGLVPHLTSLYVSGMAIGEVLDGGWLSALNESTSESWPNMFASLTFLAPGPFAILGGLLGMWTWWMFQPRPSRQAVDSTTAGEYLVVSGRLVTAPVPQPASRETLV